MGKRFGQRQQSRRQFFARTLRHASLGLIAAVGGANFVKRRKLLREGKCINHGICRRCDILDDCGLPRALSTKMVVARTGNGRK